MHRPATEGLTLRSEAKAFAAVCSLLTRDGDDGSYSASAAAFTEQDWTTLLALAKRHRVAPAIWRSLHDRRATTSVPPPVQQALKNIHRLNERRNRIIRDQATGVASLLNADGIQPVLLKTVANILERPLSDIGMWITRDIDLLVERNDFLRAAAILEAHGYAARATFNGLLHSYPALSRVGELVSVDLHRDLGPQRSLLSAEEALAHAELVVGPPCRASVLLPTHRMLHLLFHDEIQDRRFELGRISLHQLINFAYLVETYDDRIDWTEISARLRRAGHGAILPSYCHMAERLLGIRSAKFPPAGWRAKLHYRRCMIHMSSPMLQSAMTTWETLTPYMSQNRIEYMVGNRGLLFRIRHRLAYAWGVCRRNGYGIFRKIQSLRGMRVKRR